MPRWVRYTIIVLVAASLLPFALVMRSREIRSDRTKIRLVQDMGKQPKYKPQAVNPLFADSRGMRPPVAGTVSRGPLRDDEAFTLGKQDGQWIDTLPVPLTRALVARGAERYDIFCAPCHGLAGYGDGTVARRADQMQEGTWVLPSSFHTDQVRARTTGFLFNTITNGVRNMPAYGTQIPQDDRWAIVAYVRALQHSQAARVQDMPPGSAR